MGEYEIALLPFDDLSPAGCGALGVALQDVIIALESWNVRVAPLGRLRTAQKQLFRVASRGSYGDTEAELVQTAKAAALANDFYLISSALRKDRDDPIAKELVVALGGALDGANKDKSAYEIQAQYWAATLFAQSGLKPAVLSTTTRRKPDFVAFVGTLELGMTVVLSFA